MFSRSKRFNYPEPETPQPSCARCTKHATPKAPKQPKDTRRLLEQLKQLEINIQNRCDTMDSLCRDYLNTPSDEGFCSTRSPSPPLAMTPAFEKPLVPEGYEDFVEFCVERVASLVYKKLEEERSKKKKGIWKKTKSFFSRVNKATTQMAREFVWPKVVPGQIEL